MADSSNSDYLVKIGADLDPLSLDLEGVLDTVKDWIGEINPVAAGVVTAVAGIGIAAVDASVEFDEAFSAIVAQTGATGETLESLKQSFTDVFTTVPGDVTQLAAALSTLHDRLGLTGQDLTTISTQVAQLAAITGQSASTIAGSVASAFANWGIATADQSAKLDLLNTISQTTGVSITTLANTMSQVGNLAQLSGLSFDQAASQIAVLSKAGIDSETAFAAFSHAMGVAQQAGIDLAQVTFPNLVTAVQSATASGNGLNVAITEFGSRSGPAMYNLIASGKLTFDQFNQSVSDSADSIKNAYTQTDNFSRELGLLGNNIKTALLPIGDFITGAGRDFLAWLNSGPAATKAFNDALAQMATNADKGFTSVNSLNAGMNSLGVTISGYITVKQAQQTAEQTIYDLEQASILNQALLKESVTLLDQAETQHAANLKAVSIPALTDLATAQNNVNIYRTEAAQTDDILMTAENTLAALIASHTASNMALATAEENVSLAKAASLVANQNLQESEASLTASKVADNQITSLLKTSQDALTSAIASSYLPALQSVATAEDSVTQAKQDQTQAELAVIQAEQNLSEFRQSTGVHDATTEATLTQQLKDANTALGASTTAVKQAEDSLSLSRTTAKQLIQDQTQAETTLDQYYRQNSIVTYADVDTALQQIDTDRQAASDAAAAYAVAVQNETTILGTEGATQEQTAEAIAATKAAKDALKQSTQDLNTTEAQAAQQFGVSAQALLLIGSNAIGVANNTALLADAFNVLGVKSSASLQQMANAAQIAYQGIADYSKSSASDILNAQIASLQAQQNAWVASGTAISATNQMNLAQLKQQQADFVADNTQQWATMFNSIDKDGQQLSASLINTLFTGDGSFAQEGEKYLEQLGAAVLTAFIKPATDAIAAFVAGAVKDLFTNWSDFDTLISSTGSKIASIFSAGVPGGSGTGATGLGTQAGQNLNNLPVDGTLPTGTASSGGSSASSAVSTVTSSLSSIESAVTAVSSAVSAITSVIGLFTAQDQLDRLNGMLNKLTGIEDALFDDGGSAMFYTMANQSNLMTDFMDGFGGWLHDSVANTADFETSTNDNLMTIKAYTMLLGDIHDNISLVPGALAGIAALLPPITNVTVNVALDGNALASAVTTTIEKQLQLAGVGS